MSTVGKDLVVARGIRSDMIRPCSGVQIQSCAPDITSVGQVISDSRSVKSNDRRSPANQLSSCSTFQIVRRQPTPKASSSKSRE